MRCLPGGQPRIEEPEMPFLTSPCSRPQNLVSVPCRRLVNFRRFGLELLWKLLIRLVPVHKRLIVSGVARRAVVRFREASAPLHAAVAARGEGIVWRARSGRLIWPAALSSAAAGETTPV